MTLENCKTIHNYINMYTKGFSLVLLFVLTIYHTFFYLFHIQMVHELFKQIWLILCAARTNKKTWKVSDQIHHHNSSVAHKSFKKIWKSDFYVHQFNWKFVFYGWVFPDKSLDDFFVKKNLSIFFSSCSHIFQLYFSVHCNFPMFTRNSYQNENDA